ncbi:MAG: type VI secretion system protein TssA [Planctomycetota bacterium]
MSVLDVDRILAPVAADQPCGSDLEYDADFLAMMQAATPKPERQMGAEVIPAEEPNWRDVKQLAEKLLGRSKDLRIAVLLCRAVLHTDGIPALAAGLGAVRGLCGQYWPGLFPLLDAEDDNDPTMRVNTLRGLTDASGLLKSLREVPLVTARMAGSFGLREIEAAAGRGTVAGTPPTPELIRAAFQEVPAEHLVATHAAIGAAKTELAALDALLAERLGGHAPELRPLTSLLDSLGGELQRQLEARGSIVAPSGPTRDTAMAPPTESGGAGAATTGIQNRGDVIRSLDRICEFYAQNEPSSPVPLLLQRAKRLVNMSFLDVVRDLVPDGLTQAELFRGSTESS